MAMNDRSTTGLGLLAMALLVGAAACQASAKASINTGKEADEPSTFSEGSPPPAATTTATAAPAPVASTPPPADACPLQCFEANGSSRVDVTADEQTQLRTALEPVLSNMRGCTSASDWRRHGSAVINLRIAPDGTLSDLGIDPGRANDNGCFDQAANGANVSVSLPGRKVVRCAERCIVQNQAGQRRQTRTRGLGRRATPAATTATPAASSTAVPTTPQTQ